MPSTKYRVKYHGPNTFDNTERIPKLICFEIDFDQIIPKGTRFRLIMGRFRSISDNNHDKYKQWIDFNASVESGHVKLLSGPATAPHERGQLRLLDPKSPMGWSEMFAFGVIEVADEIPTGTTLTMSIKAMLTHHAPIKAYVRIKVQSPEVRLASRDDSFTSYDYVTIGNIIELYGEPGRLAGIEARLRSQPSVDGTHELKVLNVDSVCNPIPIEQTNTLISTEVLGPAELLVNKLRLTGDEPVRILVRDSSRAYESITNPVVRKMFNGRRVYFGGIHWHSRFSPDGNRDIEERYTYAHDTLGLDFASVTDHTPTGYWQETLRINEVLNEPGRFITLPSWEWSTNTGHSNFYLQSPAIPAGPELADTVDHPGNEVIPDGTLVVPHHTNMHSEIVNDKGEYYWHEFD